MQSLVQNLGTDLEEVSAILEAPGIEASRRLMAHLVISKMLGRKKWASKRAIIRPIRMIGSTWVGFS
jgi:hypothetical protein